MRVEVLKPTNDDWCGSYQIQGYHKGVKNQRLVQVFFNGMIGDGVWRTSVWGNDDLGMEFDCATETECWNKFLQVIGMDCVDVVALRELGFVYA
jgi:hypothetical protein